MHNAPQRRQSLANTAAPPHGEGLTAVPSGYPSHTPLETVFMDAVRNTAPQKRPAGPPAATSTTQAKRRQFEGMQPRAAIPSSSTFSPIPTDTATFPLVPSIAATPSNTAALPSPTFLPPRQSNHTIARHTYPLPHPPTVPSSEAPSQRGGQYPSWYTSDYCLKQIEDFWRSGLVSPQPGHDRSRLEVLRGAAARQDWHYLILHQIYCLADYDRDAIEADLRLQPNFDAALHVMSSVLSPNVNLSPPVLQFFSRFPHHLSEIRLQHPIEFGKHKRAFQELVSNMKNFETLRMACINRGSPPLVIEMVRTLSVVSPIFQDMVFTSILRLIWRGPFSNPMTMHFEDQAMRYLHNERSVFERRSVEEQISHWGQDILEWRMDYIKLHEAYKTALNNQPQTRPPPQQNQQSMTVPSSRPEVSSSSRLRPQGHTVQTHGVVPRGLERASRPVPAQRRASVVAAAQSAPQVTALDRARLVPSSGPPPPMQRVPNPARFGLHQAGLRSPILKARSGQSEMCHYVRGFIAGPQRLATAGHQVEKWTLNLDSSLAQSMAQFKAKGAGAADMLLVTSGNTTVRLRCVKIPSTQPVPNEHTWATLDTSWIPYSYFSLNGTPLEQRKKLHHGRDLPIDMTCMLKEGTNVLETSVMADHGDVSHRNYMVAVEILEVMPQATVIQQCINAQRLTAEDVLASIKRKLSGTIDDDELAVVESNLSINMFDPFVASRFCNIPVRSRACLHNNCFDLKTFLETRKYSGDATVPDQWRCPICNVDARPQHLRVDDFIQQVQQELTAQGLSNTRAILVQQDGSWKPKEEVRDPNGVSDHSPSPGPQRATQLGSIEVISLLD